MFSKDGKSLKEAFVFILQILIAIWPGVGLCMQVYTPCPIKEDGTYMRCHDSYIAIIIMVALLTFIGIMFIAASDFKKTLFVKFCIIFIVICVLIAAFALFYNYPLCKMKTMPCFAMVQRAKILIPIHAATLISMIIIKMLRMNKKQ